MSPTRTTRKTNWTLTSKCGFPSWEGWLPYWKPRMQYNIREAICYNYERKILLYICFVCPESQIIKLKISLLARIPCTLVINTSKWTCKLWKQNVILEVWEFCNLGLSCQLFKSQLCHVISNTLQLICWIKSYAQQFMTIYAAFGFSYAWTDVFFSYHKYFSCNCCRLSL